MPRRSSGKRSGGRKRGPAKDWIYTDPGYGAGVVTLNTGFAGALAQPLSYSQNSRKLAVFGQLGVIPPAQNWQSWAAIPEGGNNRLYAAECWIGLAPTAWAVGNSILFGARLVVWDQSPDDGAALAPELDYSMFSQSPVNGQSPATSANLGFLRQTHFMVSNIAGTAVTATGAWNLRLSWRSQKGIQVGPGKALFLWMELATGSVQARPWLRCRSLWARER